MLKEDRWIDHTRCYKDASWLIIVEYWIHGVISQLVFKARWKISRVKKDITLDVLLLR